MSQTLATSVGDEKPDDDDVKRDRQALRDWLVNHYLAVHGLDCRREYGGLNIYQAWDDGRCHGDELILDAMIAFTKAHVTA